MYANIIKAMDEILSVWNPGCILLLEHFSVQTSYAPVAHICRTGECARMAGQRHQPQGSQCQGASGIWQLPERMNEQARESTCGESKPSRGWAGPEVPVWSVPHPRAPGPGGLLGGCRVAQCSLLTVRVWSSQPVWHTPASCGRDGLTAARIPAVGLARAGLSS